MTRSQLERGDGHEGAHLSADDTGCTILHVDMDAFYASVELIDRPELHGVPVIVGPPGGRGVVLSATYEARRLGVHSAMPMTRARRLCPSAHIITPDHRRYSAVSRGVMEIFRSVTPHVEPLSLDEAFLDVSGALRRLGSPRRIAEQIRATVATEQRITCSVGVASTKFVAKLASSRCKPDGLLVVPADQAIDYLHPLPVSALWGVGEKTAAHLDQLGLRTVGQLAHTPLATLQRGLGPAAGRHLHELAWGRDPRRVVSEHVEKSIGAEETFGVDVDDTHVIVRELLRLSEKTGRRLRAGSAAGRTVVLKVRFADFATITRSRTLREPTDVGQEIYAAARGLYDALRLERARIRLVGVRVEGIVDGGARHRQLALDERAEDWRDAELAADRAVARFGPASVRPASLIGADTERRTPRPDQPGAVDPRVRRPGGAAGATPTGGGS